jgi:hypothetical protein
MADDGSVTRWLGQLQAGDQAAVQQLWERFFLRLVGLARKKLRGGPRRAADEEDVALSAFDSFCRNVMHGRFPWPLPGRFGHLLCKLGCVTPSVQGKLQWARDI